jgi:hypothetical protein
MSLELLLASVLYSCNRLCLINYFSATLQHCTDQCSISATFQASLYKMTVSMEVLPDSHAGFQISKTIGCFS